MAASRPAAATPSGVLKICGLEQILEALKLLLSPGGERTNVGAGLDLRLAQAATACFPQALPISPSHFRERLGLCSLLYKLRRLELQEGLQSAEC